MVRREVDTLELLLDLLGKCKGVGGLMQIFEFFDFEGIGLGAV